MNVSVERLRIWLLAGAVLLVVVIAGFLGYAHYRAHRFLADLPKKLGMDIRRETNGYTYSQSVKGRTVYTIHAARAVERSNGKITLHDVGIVLYGRQHDRADRIYGNEFEYDQAAEVIRAVGEVHIDLQAPQAENANARMDYAAGKDLHADSTHAPHETKDPRLIHVTTSGLVFLRKLGVAATDNDIEFESGGLTGHAVGADYNSDTGVIVLHSAVRVNGLQDGRPIVLTATRAELDRPDQKIVIAQAKYVSVGGPEGTQTAEGQHVVVHLRKDGSAEQVEAQGDVALTNGQGAKLVAPRGQMTLSEHNQPQSAVMKDGVKYSTTDPLRQAQGEAAEAHAAFDSKGSPERVTMKGAVHLRERTQTSVIANQPWSERELNAATLDLTFNADSSGKAQLSDAKATDRAQLKVRNATWIGGKPAITTSVFAGDILTAHFMQSGKVDHISEVHSDGHTSLRRLNAKGVLNTSSADSLVAHFQPAATGIERKAGSTGNGPGIGHGDEIVNAVEQGHVLLTQSTPPKAGEATSAEEKTTAARAEYTAQPERTTLTGNVQVTNGTSVLWADRVITEQQSGDATAEGSVKASYGQPGSTAEPAHVLAAHAEVKHDSQVAIFYGVPGTPARLWQGSSQVEAPVLQFDQKQKRLLAHGTGQGAPMAVHTVLVSAPSTSSPDSPKPRTPEKSRPSKTNVIRVQSRELLYSDQARRADFTGGVAVESADGSMHGQQVAVFLQPAPAAEPPGTQSASTIKPGNAKAPNGFMAGSVERIVANGSIELQQPGRHATGDRMVYTASDGMFVLTGTSAVLPKVIDDQRGTITGASLRFHAADEDVVVSNGGDNSAGHRVHTETRVKNKQ